MIYGMEIFYFARVQLPTPTVATITLHRYSAFFFIFFIGISSFGILNLLGLLRPHVMGWSVV